AVSIPLCAVCIWISERYLANGAIGAVCSDAILETYLLTAYLRALPRGILNLDCLRVPARSLAAALPLIGLFWLTPDRHTLSALLIGLLLHTALCCRLRCFHPHDLEIVRRLCRKAAWR